MICGNMGEVKYKILDSDNIILAEKMTLDMVFAFIRGFKESFYHEALDLRIVEMTIDEF